MRTPLKSYQKKRECLGHSLLRYVSATDTAKQSKDKYNPDDCFPIDAADAVTKIA